MWYVMFENITLSMSTSLTHLLENNTGTDLDTSVQNVNSYAGSISTGAGNVPVLTTLDAPGITVDPSIFTQIDQAQVDVADAK